MSIRTHREANGLLRVTWSSRTRTKPEPTFRLSKSRPMWATYQSGLSDREEPCVQQRGRQCRGKRRGDCPRSTSDSVLETTSACWGRTNMPSEWPFEKVVNFWTRSSSPLRALDSGRQMPKPGFYYLLWNPWEYPKFAVWFIFITPVWDTSMDAWKGRVLSF